MCIHNVLGLFLKTNEGRLYSLVHINNLSFTVGFVHKGFILNFLKFSMSYLSNHFKRRIF